MDACPAVPAIKRCGTSTKPPATQPRSFDGEIAGPRTSAKSTRSVSPGAAAASATVSGESDIIPEGVSS